MFDRILVKMQALDFLIAPGQWRLKKKSLFSMLPRYHKLYMSYGSCLLYGLMAVFLAVMVSSLFPRFWLANFVQITISFTHPLIKFEGTSPLQFSSLSGSCIQTVSGVYRWFCYNSASAVTQDLARLLRSASTAMVTWLRRQMLRGLVGIYTAPQISSNV